MINALLLSWYYPIFTHGVSVTPWKKEVWQRTWVTKLISASAIGEGYNLGVGLKRGTGWVGLRGNFSVL